MLIRPFPSVRVVLALTVVATFSPRAPRAQTLYERAQAALRRDQVDSAWDLVRRAADAEPNRADVQFLFGNIACTKAGRAGFLSAYGLARKCKAGLARAVELAPDSLPYLEGLASFLAQAPGLVGGDKDSAMRLAERVRARDEVRGAFLLAGLWWSGNAASKARSDSVVAAVADGHPDDQLVQLRAAEWWARTLRPERALAVYERLAARQPTDGVARFFLGRQLVVMKREPRRAQEHLRFAAEADVPAPDTAGKRPTFTPGAPWWRLGQSYEQLGMADSARLCFEQALRVNPQLDVAKQSLDSLSRRGDR